MTHATPARRYALLLVAACALVLTAACDKQDDNAAKPAAAAGGKPVGTDLSTVPGTSIKRVADDAKAEPRQDWTFNGLDAKAVELHELIVRTLPPDGHVPKDAKLPEGRYDVKIDASGRTPEEMRPTLFKALESAFGMKLSLTRKDMDGFVIRAADGATPPPTLAKADDAAQFSIAPEGTGTRFTAVSMDTFADWAATELGQPVANATDLPGRYTFELPLNDVDPPTLTAAAKALGLEIVPQKLEQQVLVVEQVDAAGK